MGIPGVALKKHDILDAIKEKEGLLIDVAEKLNCSRSTLYTWMDNDSDVKEAFEKARAERDRTTIHTEQRIVNKATKMIELLIDKGDITATIFALKSKGKWVDKHEQQVVQNKYIINGKGMDIKNDNSDSD